MSQPGNAPAAQQAAGTAASPRSDYCIFERDGRRFALSTNIAKEVLEARPFTPVPHAPNELLGAFNLRGEVIPLVNFDRFLEVASRPAARGDTLLLLSHGDISLAAVVDQVVVIKHVSPWEIRRAKLDPTIRNPLVRGVVGSEDEQTLVLDGERLLAAVVEQIAAGLRGRTRTSAAGPMLAAPGGSTRADAASQSEAGSAASRHARAGGDEGMPTGEHDPQGSPPGVQLPAGGR